MSHWTKETLLNSSEEFFAEVFRRIENAKDSILVETYIFGVDSLGDKIYDQLVEKSKQGVEVRMIVDGVGSARWINRQASRLVDPHFSVRVYHPLPWPFLHWKLSSEKSFRRTLKFWSSVNQRDHRKLMIFDGESAIVGSCNLHQESLSWQEKGLLLEGVAANVFLNLFNAVWKRSDDFTKSLFKRKLKTRLSLKALRSPREQPLKIVDVDAPIRTNENRTKRQLYFNDLVVRIKKAKNQISIVSPYFVPPKKIMDALCLASNRGVKVEVLSAGPSDVRLVKLIAPIFFKQLLKCGVAVYEYQSRILHAKSLRIDDFVLMGSSNLNHRSLRRDLEIDVSLSDPMTKQNLQKSVAEDIESSRKVSANEVRFYNPVSWLLAKFILIMKDWL